MSKLLRSGWKAVPWGLVGMLCLMVPVERFVARHGFEFLDAVDWSFVRKDYQATCEARKYDVLVFGDSLSVFGVVPRAVAERSGRKVCHLAVSGGQAPASYFLLKRALDSGARPSAVVVDFYPPLLILGPRTTPPKWASFLGVFEAARLAWWARDPDLFGIVATGRLIPSVQARPGLRDNVVAAFAGRTDWRAALNLVSFRNWARNQGAQLMKPASGYQQLTEAQLDRYRDDNFPDLRCHPANVEGVRRFLALAAERGVTVYWVLPPMSPQLEATLARGGFDAKHEAFVKSWQARFPNLVAIDGRGAVNGSDAYFDQSHLAAPGAYAYSLALGDALRRGVPPSRWVKLPACAVGPVPAEVEDMQQTLASLNAGATIQR